MSYLHNRASSARWERTRIAVFVRDGYRCKRCGRAGALQCHHVREVASGGDFWDMANLETLCRDCHRNHHAKPPDPAIEDWKVLLAAITSDTP